MNVRVDETVGRVPSPKKKAAVAAITTANHSSRHHIHYNERKYGTPTSDGGGVGTMRTNESLAASGPSVWC